MTPKMKLLLICGAAYVLIMFLLLGCRHERTAYRTKCTINGTVVFDGWTRYGHSLYGDSNNELHIRPISGPTRTIRLARDDRLECTDRRDILPESLK